MTFRTSLARLLPLALLLAPFAATAGPRLHHYPATGTCPPVLILSHGLGGSEEGLSDLAFATSQAGFDTWVMGHPASGKPLLKAVLEASNRQAALEAAVADPAVNAERAETLSGTVDFVLGQAACTPPLMVMGGHSMGAQTVMIEAGARNNVGVEGADRFDAYVALSSQGVGGRFPADAWHGITKPLLMVTGTQDRSHLFAAQTPQGFRFGQIFSAHIRAETVSRDFTDDAEIAEWAGLGVTMVEGERTNIKITHPEDFSRAERIIMADLSIETRIGTGYDVHPFAPGDAVWLCGVKIPHKAKLQGHSDADVALHALTDAILGAIGEGDIGTHFPPSDAQWKGAASTLFLAHAGELVARRKGRIVNLDVTIVAEAPRIAAHVPAMCAVIAETLGISADRVAVKATTNEKLGFIGREEGIVSMASASIELPRVD